MISWNNAKNILCIRLDNAGDVLMCSPALRALKQALPGRRLTLLASEAGREMGALMPEIDQTIVYTAPWIKSCPPRVSNGLEQRIIQKLSRGGFDAAVIFTVYSQSALPAALLSYLAGIPLRAAHCRENPYQLLSHWLPESEPEKTLRHEVKRQLDLVAALGAPAVDEDLSLRISVSHRRSLERKLAERGIDKDFIVVHPGASALSRRYPAEGFAAIVKMIRRKTGMPVVLTGTLPEAGLVKKVVNGNREGVFSLVGVLVLGELAALIDKTRLLISNNTAPVHLAAALKVPVVVLYALTNPQHTPWKTPNRVLFQDVPCKFCYKSVCPQEHHHCLRLVTPARVVNEAIGLLKETEGRSRISRSSRGFGIKPVRPAFLPENEFVRELDNA